MPSISATTSNRHCVTQRVHDLLEHLRIPHAIDAPLATRTWYGVGGAAEVLARPASMEQLTELVACCHSEGVPTHILGSGANLLVADEGIRGVVIQLDSPAFQEVTPHGNHLAVGAGHDLMKLITLAAARGLAGLEGLAGIPASVGGAVRMNAGGAFGDTGQTITRVRVMDAAGRVHDIERSSLVFSYRHSNIDEPLILETHFALEPGDADVLRSRVKEVMAYKKGTQPMGASSAGCTWKNPTPPKRYLSHDQPPEADDPRAMPAGMLVDQAGLKGFAVGRASISDHHANFIVCQDGCTATDVLGVMAHAESVVREKFGVALQREVVVWS